MTIHPGIREAIRPVLDRADALLDYYTEGLPREAWEPLAQQINPTALESYLHQAAHYAKGMATAWHE